MYRQQSLITLDQFYEIKPLTKLESILSFVDFSLLENTFPIDSHRKGPKGYSKKQLLSVLIAMQTEQIVNVKALVQKLKIEPVFKRNCGFDYLDNTPSEATLNCFITQLSDMDILERTYRRMIHKARIFGLIDGTNVAIDASKINAYELQCPHVCGKCNCVMGSTWCTNAKSGYVGKVKIKDNPRFITAPFRGTEAFEKLYNQRTSVERTFGELKGNYALDNLRVVKMKRAKVFMDISCISMLASRLATAEKEQKKHKQKSIA